MIAPDSGARQATDSPSSGMKRSGWAFLSESIGRQNRVWIQNDELSIALHRIFPQPIEILGSVISGFPHAQARIDIEGHQH
jgi:hypothetical protein